MGWEQLPQAIQSGFDTYWGRKEGQKGRAHELEMQGKRIAHDKLQRDLDRAQEKFIADRTAELTEQGMEQAEAIATADRESRELIKSQEIGQKQKEVTAAEAAQTRGDIFTRQERVAGETFAAGQTGIEQTRLNQQAALDRTSRERVAEIHADAGGDEGGLSVGALGMEIKEQGDIASRIFKQGWKVFSRDFPGLLEDEKSFNMLKTAGSDKVINDYLTAEIAKEYIALHGSDYKRREIDLGAELKVALNLGDDYMAGVQAAFDALPAGGGRKPGRSGQAGLPQDIGAYQAEVEERRAGRKEGRMTAREEIHGTGSVGEILSRAFGFGKGGASEAFPSALAEEVKEGIEKTFGVSLDEDEDKWWKRKKKK